jgi:hypothetical protein
MKRFASIIAIAAFSLPLATSVSADELSYALAYEAEIERWFVLTRNASPELKASYNTLQKALINDRANQMNLVGRIKTNMCAGLITAEKIKDAAIREYVKGPQRANDKLQLYAVVMGAKTIEEIPCK